MDSLLAFGLIAIFVEPFACEVLNMNMCGGGARQVSPGN